MLWLWPHLRRLWAAAGTVSAGFAVNYLYGRLGNQPAPTLSRLIDYLWLLEPERAGRVRRRIGLRRAAIPQARGAGPVPTKKLRLNRDLTGREELLSKRSAQVNRAVI